MSPSRVSGRRVVRRKRQLSRGQIVWKASYYLGLLALFLLALASLMPLYWMITGSFKIQSDAIQIPPEWFPAAPTLENYRKLLFATTPTFRWFLNSLVVASGVAFFAVLTSLLAGYAFGKKEFPGKTVLFWLLILTMMLPKQISLIPLYILMQKFKWFNSYQGMIAPYIAYPFGIFLVKQFMQSIPNDLLDAARIDGASEIGLFRHVIVPLTKPAVGALAIFAFVAGWNDYIWQLLMITRRKMLTLPVGVSKLTAGLDRYDLGLAMAGATFAFVPMLIIFLVFKMPAVVGFNLLLVPISLLLSFVLSFCFDYLIGVTSFYTESIWGLVTVKKIVIGVFSGLMIPIAFFPQGMQRVLAALPFQAIYHTPLSMIVDPTLSLLDCARMLGIQLFWVVIMFLAGRLFYLQAVKTLTINGG